VSELSVVYRNYTFSNVRAFWNLEKENNLENTLSEVHKLVEIVLIIPVLTAESEHCFISLKRVQTYSYLRNSMGQERLNTLAVLSIHKEATADSSRFNQKVIELFALQKHRRRQFINK
jgi:hypothetical protein